MKVYIKDLKNQIVPLIFSINLTYWTLSLIMGCFIIKTMIAVVMLHSIFFIWFKHIYKIEKWGGVYFVITSIVYLFIAVMIMVATDTKYGMTLTDWFINMKPENALNTGYWISSILLLTYFYSTAVFYFTFVSFRMTVILLISIIALSLQTLLKYNDINLPFILFLGLFILMYMEYTKVIIKSKDLSHRINNNWYLQAVGIFLSLTLLLAIMIPKPNTIPKIVGLDNIINKFSQPFKNTNMLNKLNSGTDISFSGIPTSTKVIFEVKAQEPLYLRTQSFDRYEDNYWRTGFELPISVVKNNKDNSQIRFNKLSDVLENINPNTTPINELEPILNSNSIPQSVRTATIITQNYKMPCFISLPGLTNIRDTINKKTIYLDETGKFVLSGNRGPDSNEEYNIDYISQNINSKSRELQILKYMNRERYNYISGFANKTLNSYKSEMDFVYEYYTQLPSNITARTYELANNITEGKVSDYDKASAIENFFYSSNFKYGTVTQKIAKGLDYNDFFLFQSKQGVCVQFASAMVILARASGLPARYVEGYKSDERDESTGNYIVREKHGHAYPEIYIAGYGWKVFEPTVGTVASWGGLNIFFSEVLKKLNSIILRGSVLFRSIPIYMRILFIPISIIIIILLIRIFISIRHKYWRKKIIKANKKQAIEEIFSRTNSLLMKIKYNKKKHETPANYSLRISNEIGIKLDNLINVFDKSKYGDIEPSIEEIWSALCKYEEVSVFVKNSVGRVKAWII